MNMIFINWILIVFTSCIFQEIPTSFQSENAQKDILEFVDEMDRLLRIKYGKENPFENLMSFIEYNQSTPLGITCLDELQKETKDIQLLKKVFKYSPKGDLMLIVNKGYPEYIRHASRGNQVLIVYSQGLEEWNDITPSMMVSFENEMNEMDLGSSDIRFIIGIHFLYLCGR